jgi:hypothetical protein
MSVAVYPHSAEMLAVVTLHENNLGFEHPYPDCNTTKGHQSEYLEEL